MKVMMKQLVFIFVLLVATFASCWGEDTTNEEAFVAANPGFNYFLLAMTWPNHYCNSTKCKPPYPKQYFTVHGLWPQLTSSSSPQFCTTTEQLTDATLQGLEVDLLTYWPALKNADDFNASKGFWRYEWNKHGTCSSDKYTAAQYFQKTIDLAKVYSGQILQALAHKGVMPNGNAYPSLDIFQAIVDGLGVVPKLSISSQSLAEIRLCVKNDAVTLFNCGSVTNYGNVTFAAPPVLPPSPSPSPSQSLSQFPSPSRSTRWWVSSVLEAVQHAAAAIL